MKKTLLMGAACIAAAGAYAQTVVEPKILEEFYAQKISPDGRWIYSDAANEEIIIYDLATDKYNLFYNVTLGNGNPIALDGTCVGSKDTGGAIVIKGDKSITPKPLRNTDGLINGITPDATRIVGIVQNPAYGGTDDDIHQMYLPFVADVDVNGECDKLIYLPYPEKDFFGLTPQYNTATWISDDGKTVLGQMIDYSGYCRQPLVYQQDGEGEWSYSLPSKHLFNPENIPLPEYPGEFDYSLYPDPLEYMTPEMQEMYLEDYEYWRDHLGDPDVAFPGDHLEDYMDDDQIEAYNKAVALYNEYATLYNEQMEAFMEARNAILDTSVSFVQNAYAMNSEGTLASLTSSYSIDKGDGNMPVDAYGAYSLDIVSGELSKIDTQYTGLIAGQVLDGGVFISSTPTEEYPAAFIYVPGAADFVPVQDYLAEGNPSAVKWMEENLVHELASGGGNIDPYSDGIVAHEGERMAMITGLGMASRDFSVFAGAVPAYMFDPVLVYMTYVFSDMVNGVECINVEADNSAVNAMGNGVLAISAEVSSVEVYDLSGRRVFGAQNVSGVVDTKLSKGIYVVAYIDANGNRNSLKCKM